MRFTDWASKLRSGERAESTAVKAVVRDTVKEVKDDGVISMTFTRRVVDRDSEVIEPGGGRLDDFAKNPVFLWAHQYRQPSIGKVLMPTVEQTDEEVFGDIKFDMADPFAALIFGKYRGGFLNASSIGFIPIEFSREQALDNQKGVTITVWDLLELSGVPVPSNPGALQRELALARACALWDNGIELGEDDTGLYHLMVGAGNDVRVLAEERAVVPYRSYPLADEAASWSFGVADGNVLLGPTGADWEKYATVHAWCDPSGERSRAKYKLPHHKVLDGQLKTVWRAVASAMAVLLGGRGGAGIPEEDRKDVYNHLAKHYGQFGKEAPEFKAWDDFAAEERAVYFSGVTDADMDDVRIAPSPKSFAFDPVTAFHELRQRAVHVAERVEADGVEMTDTQRSMVALTVEALEGIFGGKVLPVTLGGPGFPVVPESDAAAVRTLLEVERRVDDALLTDELLSLEAQVDRARKLV